MPAYHFEITGNDTQLRRTLERVRQDTRQTAAAVERDGIGLEGMFKRLKAAAAAAAAGFTAQEFIRQVIQARGAMQQLEVSFKTMLGSKKQAEALMQQMIQTAATTPFGLDEVAGGAKQLLAYGMEAEKVNDTLIRLGDIASGLSIPLGDLIYLYGTTMAQGRLYTMDLNQFTGRGIPMIAELAKQFGVAESEVRGLVEQGRVGFPEVQRVIESLTNEGGKFGGLMKEQSKTISGQISNIGDAISGMFNEIGQQNEGIINGALSTVKTLIDHYEQVGRAIMGIVGTYGTYKAAVIAAAAVEEARYLLTLKQGAADKVVTSWQAIKFMWTNKLTAAQAALNSVMNLNPFILAATALAALVAVIISAKTETEILEEAQKAYDEAKKEAIEQEEAHRREIEKTIAIAEDESLSTDTRRLALVKLESKYPDIFAKYDTEASKLENIKRIKQEIAELDGQNSISNPKNELKQVEDKISKISVNKAGRALTDELDAELKTLQARRAALQSQIQKEKTDRHFANLTGISNAELEREIKRRRELLARMDVSGKQYARLAGGREATRGTFDRKEIQGQLQLLQSEQNRRNQKTATAGQWIKQAQKEYQEAIANLENFKQSANTLTEEAYKKGIADLQGKVKEAKDKLDKTGYKAPKGTGGGKGNADAASEAAAAEKEAQRRRDAATAEIEALKRANSEAAAALITDSRRREETEARLQYEKELSDILKKEETVKQAGTPATEATAAIAEARALAERKYKAEIERINRESADEEARALTDYLTRYGTYQERRLAIAQDYAARINAAQTKGERLSLQAEKEQALSQADTAALKDSLNWEALFGDLERYSIDYLQSLKEQVRAFIETSKGTLTPESIKELTDALAKLDSAMQGQTWTGQNLPKLTEAKNLRSEAARKQAAAAVADQNLTAARSKLIAARQIKDAALIEEAAAELSKAEQAAAKAAKAAAAANDKAALSFREYADIAAESLTKLADKVGTLSDIVSELGLGNTGVGKALSNGAAGLNSAASAAGALASGDFLGAALGGIQAIKSFGKMLGIGNATNAKEVQETTDRLTKANEALGNQIDHLRDTMDESNGLAKVEAANKAIGAQKDINAQTMEVLKAQMSYYGAHHSNASKFKLSKGDWSSINQALAQYDRENGTSTAPVNDLEGLYGLTPEAMDYLRDNLAAVWDKIINAGDYDKSEYWEQYADLAGKIEELEQLKKEAATGVTFTSMRDNFVSQLMDMNRSSQDFADDLSAMLMEAVLNARIGNKLDKELQAYYDEWSRLSEDGLTEEEIQHLQEMYNAIVKKGEEIRDEAAQITGYDKAQERSAGQSGETRGFAQMSQDTAEELNGRFTALQIAGEAIRTNSAQITAGITKAGENLSTIIPTLNTITQLAAVRNDTLRSLADDTRQILKQWTPRLQTIEENTRNLDKL